MERIKHSINLGQHALLCLVLGLAMSASEMRSAYAHDGEKIQSLSELHTIAEAFLQTQVVNIPGKVSLTLGHLDPNLRLPACPQVQASLAAGSRPWGRTSVQMKCSQPNWSVYIQAVVSVTGSYLVTANPLPQGKTLTAEDVLVESGDLTQLPAGIMTSLNEVQGRLLVSPLAAGTMLRKEMLKVAPVVQQGQMVTLRASGRGFSISTEGEAMANAGEGQVVAVKVSTGQIVRGIARAGGEIEVGVQVN